MSARGDMRVLPSCPLNLSWSRSSEDGEDGKDWGLRSQWCGIRAATRGPGKPSGDGARGSYEQDYPEHWEEQRPSADGESGGDGSVLD